MGVIKLVFLTTSLFLTVSGLFWAFGSTARTSSGDSYRIKNKNSGSISFRHLRSTITSFTEVVHCRDELPRQNNTVVSGNITTPTPSPSKVPQRNLSGIEFVIVCFDEWKLESTAIEWQKALELPVLAELNPYVTIYCQNPDLKGKGIVEEKLAPILKNGQVIYLENIGREGRAYLLHIINYQNDLLRYTWFSQDERDWDAFSRVWAYFKPGKTGMLNVGPSWGVDCDDSQWPWDHAGVVTRLQESIYALSVGKVCEYFYAVYKGQFIVSAERIRRNYKPKLFRYLLQLLEAPRGHAIHDRHGLEQWKDPSNPWFGHVIERSWSLLFDCHDNSMAKACDTCENSGWKTCTQEACQCFDREPVATN